MRVIAEADTHRYHHYRHPHLSEGSLVLIGGEQLGQHLRRRVLLDQQGGLIWAEDGLVVVDVLHQQQHGLGDELAIPQLVVRQRQHHRVLVLDLHATHTGHMGLFVHLSRHTPGMPLPLSRHLAYLSACL